MAEFRTIIDSTVDEHLDSFWDVALDLFEHPQVAFEEEYASGVCKQLLEDEGFEVSVPCESLPTSFLGTHSTGDGPTIAILCEYDALPELGHACGHPLIAMSGVLAGVAAKRAMDEAGVSGTVKVFGTPAEESGAGKDIMLKAGNFDDCDAALLCHPTTLMTRVAGRCCSSQEGTATFTGAPAQAQSHPDQGINVLDAVALTQAAIGMARQQLFDDIHISLVVTEMSSTLISIPEHAVIEFGVSTTGPASHLKRGVDVVERALKGAAIATGCELEFELKTDALYLGRIENEAIGAVMREEIRGAGELCQDGLPMDAGGEDFGNVIRVIPGVQMFCSLLLDRKVSGHTEEFKALAKSDAGKHMIEICAKSLARTSLALMESPETVEAAKAELAERMKAENE